MKKISLFLTLVLISGILLSCSSKQNASDYIFSDWEQGVAIEKYCGEEKRVYLPAEYNGKKVLCIKDDAFYQCTNIEEIVFSDSLECIEGSPFYRCYSLKKVIMNQSLVHMETNPFYRCSALEEIVFSSPNRQFAVEDGVLYDRKIRKLICYPEGKKDKQFIVPESIIHIGEDAFGYCPYELSEIKIHEGVILFNNGPLTAIPWRIKLIVKKNSVAEEYAQKNQYVYEYYN